MIPCRLLWLALICSACEPNRTELGGHYPAVSKAEETPWVKLEMANTPAIDNPAIAYDVDRQRVVLFGGKHVFGVGVPPTFSDETWLFNGSRWEQAVTSVHPPPRAGHTMTFDARRGRAVLFGGFNDQTSLADTWEWDGTRWQDVTAKGEVLGAAATLRNAVLLYDAQRGAPVLMVQPDFSAPGAQWVRRDGAWQALPEPGPPGAILAAAFDPIRKVTVATGWTVTGMQVFESSGAGWTSVEQGHLSFVAPAVFDATRRRIVAVASLPSDGIRTLEWQDAVWVIEPLAVGPPVVLGPMAYDSGRGRVVMVGVGSQDPTSAQTWER